MFLYEMLFSDYTNDLIQIQQNLAPVFVGIRTLIRCEMLELTIFGTFIWVINLMLEVRTLL